MCNHRHIHGDFVGHPLLPQGYRGNKIFKKILFTLPHVNIVNTVIKYSNNIECGKGRNKVYNSIVSTGPASFG